MGFSKHIRSPSRYFKSPIPKPSVMLDSNSFLVVSALIFLFTSYLRKKITSSHKLPYPPGPRAWPVIGNVWDIPKVTPWVTYTNWRKTYGDLIYISALGQPIVIINSADIAVDLLDKRSGNYSDRPSIPMAEMTGWTSLSLALMPYGSLWRKHRRHFHQKFRQDAAPAFQSLQLRKAHELLRHLLSSPKDFTTHLRNFPAAVIMYLTYGHEIASLQDPLVVMADDLARELIQTILLGAHLVNVFPILRFIPEWMPGAGFKSIARNCRDKVDELQEVPFDLVKQHMAAGISIPSWTTELLERNNSKGGGKEGEVIIKAVTGTAFAVSIESSSSSLETFILAMTLYPEVQAKAQAEIISVIGNQRLPTFEDRERLPYVDALCREVLRWRPSGPLGVPHAALNDDVYNGYFIPQGTMVLANIWAMCHDERAYNEPEKFMPERFIAPDGSLTGDAIPTFGFGRRICVGRSLADAILWIAAVSILSVFNITKAKDENGCALEVVGAYSDGLSIHPEPFPCLITPRSEEIQHLIPTAV